MGLKDIATFIASRVSPAPKPGPEQPRGVLPLSFQEGSPVSRFADVEAFAKTWACAITDGALRLEQPLGAGAPLETILIIGDDRLPGQQLKLLDETRTRVELTLTPAAKSRLGRHMHERREGRPVPRPDGVNRQAERFHTALDVHFADMPELAESYATDISHGGLFIACPSPPPLGKELTLHMELPTGRTIDVPVIVVQRVTTGKKCGAGVQFKATAEELEPIRELVRQYTQRRPRVLVVEDEAIWRSSLTKVLNELNADVVLASDGHEGLEKLTDLLFDLDLVVLDLHMPNLDGRGLLERVRHHGNEMGLRIFVFSGAGTDELADVAKEGLANAVISKTAPLDELVSRLRIELGKPTPDLH